MDDEELDTPHGRLRWARKRAGFESAAAFSEVVDIGAVTYRAYENGQIGFSKHAPLFGRKLGVTGDWLVSGGPPPSAAAASTIRDLEALASEMDISLVRKVDISYAMGDGSVVADYPETGMMPFDRHFLSSIGARNTEVLFVCSGTGDSMDPTIKDSDTIMVDTSRKKIGMQDQIWALTVAGAGMVKRIRPLPEAKVMVISDNPLVPDQVYDSEDVYVVGKVVWIGRKM